MIVQSGQYDYKLETNNLVVELVYVDSSKGWQIIENVTSPSGLSTVVVLYLLIQHI